MKARLPYIPAAESGEGMAGMGEMTDVSDIWKIFVYRRRTIFAAVAVCVACAAAYSLFAPSQYTATAQILIDPRDRQIVSKDVNPDTLAADGGVVLVESQAKVIESDSVLLRAVDSAGLANDPDFGGRKPGIMSTLSDLIDLIMGTASSDPAAQRNKALRALQKNLTVKRADRVFVIDVTVMAKTAEKAAHISDAVAEAYIADQIAARGQSSRRASDALAARLVDLRDGVQEAERKVEDYKAAHDIVGTNRELVTDQQLDDSGAKLANARSRTEELRARVDQIEALRRSGADKGAIPEALQSSVITQLRASAQDLLRRESDLRTRLGDRHPDLIALVEQIQEVKRQINAELDRLARGAKSDYERARAYERSLTATLDKSKLKTLSVDQDSVALHELNRELDARRALYQAFLGRAAETRAQADIDTTNSRIISKAIPPNKSSWPPRAFIILGAIGGGLGLGAGLALLLEYLAPTVLSAGQLEHLAEAQVIGILRAPRAGPAPAPRRRFAWRPRVKPSPDKDVILALSRLCGPLAAMRGIHNPYCLLVTSAESDAAARARAVDRIAAVAGARDVSVLLIGEARDAAERSAKGFLNVVSGDVSLLAAVRPHSSGRAKRLSLGAAPGAGLPGLTEDQINRFVEEAGRYFDLILFDGAVFEQNMAIAALAARAGDLLFVAVQGVTSQRAARETSRALTAFTGQSVTASLLLQAA